MNTKALRQKVLDLAIHGKLVPQNPNDESATVLLEKNRAEKAEKIKKGELKADKKDSFIFVGSDKRHYEQFADGTVKDIEDEIPFEVPEGWAWCRLPEICVIPITDGTHQTPTYSDKENGVPFLSSKDVTSGKIDWSKIKYITKELHQELQKRIAPKKDDILLAKNGTTGVAAIVEDETIFDIYVTLAVIRPNQKIVYPKFLLNIVNSPFCKNQFNEHLTGIGVPNLHLVDINKTFVPLPPLNEQRQITDKIGSYTVHIDELEKNKSDLQTAINKTKSKILDLAIHGKLVPQDPNDEPAEELLKRIATSDNRPYEKVDEEPFEIPDSWKWVKLSSICNKLVDGEHNPPKGIEEKTEYIMASSRNINYDRLDDLENVRYLSKEVFEIENNRTKAEKGDIFFTSVGTLGRSCIYSGDYNICFQRSVTILNTIINNQFLKYFFDSNFFQTYVIEHSTGTAQMGFYLKEMANSPITIPPMHEQARIVDKVSELFYQLDQIQNNLV